MTRCHFESFTGFKLQVFENRLRDQGTVTVSCYSHDGTVVTFPTKTGNFSFHCGEDKPIKRLSDGRYKLLGDYGRWAYLVPTERKRP